VKKTLTFIDSNVLIAAATGKGKQALRALAILNDSAREFASSPFVRLETVPKAVFHKQQLEVAFYERFFADVQAIHSTPESFELLIKEAEKVGGQFGLNMADALHIAAALDLAAEEFITAERPTSPFRNVKGIKIISIYTP
jgi:predicted nucleic acid-binding protein